MLIWTGIPQRDEQPYVIPQRRITDRLPALRPKGMTTFVARRLFRRR